MYQPIRDVLTPVIVGLGILYILYLGINTNPASYAQENVLPIVSGQVIKNDSSGFVLGTSQGEREINTQELTVNRNGEPIALEEVAVGEQVDIQTDGAGRIINMRVGEKQPVTLSPQRATISSVFTWVVLILVIIGLAVVGIVGFFIYLIRRNAQAEASRTVLT